MKVEKRQMCLCEHARQQIPFDENDIRSKLDFAAADPRDVGSSSPVFLSSTDSYSPMNFSLGSAVR